MEQDFLFPNLNEYNYNPLNDVLFKFIFGKEERKQITIAFLNAVLQEGLGTPIKDLTFTGTEMNPENETDKLTRLDVACVLDNGTQVDVEVQVTDEKNMPQRTLYYWSQMYLMSLPAGKTYRDLKPSITINLVNFSFLPSEEAHSVYGIYNMKNGHQLTGDLAIHFLEIPKYAKQPTKPISQMTKMERWLAYFANRLDHIGKEELAMSEVAIQNAMEAARIFLSNTEERRRYINREMARMDRISQLETSHKDGVEEGVLRMSKLIQILLSEGRTADITAATTDPMIRNQLFLKYGL